MVTRSVLILGLALSACDVSNGGTGRAECTSPAVVTYDWNDGTAEGWTDTDTSAASVAGALSTSNHNNGSLQIFGPAGTYALAETDVITFTVRVQTYSSVASPAALASSRFEYLSPIPGDGSLTFSLDMTGLAFGEARAFALPVSTGVTGGATARAAFLADPGAPSLMFAEHGFEANTSTATLDDYSVGCAEL